MYNNEDCCSTGCCLVRRSEKEYGSDYKSHVLSIYKMLAKKADDLCARKESANRFYLFLVLLDLALVGHFACAKPALRFLTNYNTGHAMAAVMCLAGVAICYQWHKTMKCYHMIAEAKFKVLHDLEKCLPVAPMHAICECMSKCCGNSCKSRCCNKCTPIVFKVIFLLLIVGIIYAGRTAV
jgi:hypothetical protein